MALVNISEENFKSLLQVSSSVSEEMRIYIDSTIEEFTRSVDRLEISLPKSLSSRERAYAHLQAATRGLDSGSHGIEPNRCLTISKVVSKKLLDPDVTRKANLSVITLSHEDESCLNQLFDLINSNGPPYKSDSCSVLQKNDNSEPSFPKVDRSVPLAKGSFQAGIIPTISTTANRHRSSLQIWKWRNRILRNIQDNRVTLIQGDTGCGKSTQVPQFILDEAAVRKTPVNVVCTVPRRIAAVSLCERVAYERYENIGFNVGYHIRFDNCTTKKTILTYCTPGILLRRISSNDSVLSSLTHIIIDEIHERERETDFLLTYLKENLPSHPRLRLILMGADIDTDLFLKYFEDFRECNLLTVPGFNFPVQTKYLEDILLELKCSKRRRQKSFLTMHSSSEDPNVLIDNVCNRDENSFRKYMNQVQQGVLSLTHRHIESGYTLMMAVAKTDCVEWAAEILNRSYDLEIILFDWINYDICRSLHEWLQEQKAFEILKLVTQRFPTIQESLGEKILLNNYFETCSAEQVDLMLVAKLVHHLCCTTKSSEAILIFLPGYEEIVTLNHILSSEDYISYGLKIFLLHSNIHSNDQKLVFRRCHPEIRKIVLATNIAETSLTINDIVYVIDCGKANENLYDPMVGSNQLKKCWISAASANQRKGRAGRCQRGVCYRLYSGARFESLSKFTVPSILKSSLGELCLYARSILPVDLSIEDFFSKLPEPPPSLNVTNSINSLKEIGALDQEERITKLGSHLLRLPLEPHLGKALIMAATFKCLEPVSILVSVMSYRSPFSLPSNPMDKLNVLEKAKILWKNSYSDHFTILEAYNKWIEMGKVSSEKQKEFCYSNYLSEPTLIMIRKIQRQLVTAIIQLKSFNRRNIPLLNKNSNNWALIKAVLVSSLYPNLFRLNHSRSCITSSFSENIKFHPSSLLSLKEEKVRRRAPTEWIVFDEINLQKFVYLLRNNTAVSDLCVALFAGYDVKIQDAENYSILNIAPHVAVKGSKETIEKIYKLRNLVEHFLTRKLCSNSKFDSVDKAILKTLATLLQRRDTSSGFGSISVS